MSGSNSPGTHTATWWHAALMIRGQTEVDQRNIRAVWVWCFVGGVGFAAVMSVFKAFPQLQGPFAWLLAAISVALCFAAVCACVRFIREADEFMRKVQLEGLAIGFAAGFVFCIAYHALEHFGAPRLPIVLAVAPLCVGWAVGSFIVALRHR